MGLLSIVSVSVSIQFQFQFRYTITVQHVKYAAIHCPITRTNTCTNLIIYPLEFSTLSHLYAYDASTLNVLLNGRNYTNMDGEACFQFDN